MKHRRISDLIFFLYQHSSEILRNSFFCHAISSNKHKSLFFNESILQRMCQSDEDWHGKTPSRRVAQSWKWEKSIFFRERKWLIEFELIYGKNLHQPKVSNRSYSWEQGKRNSVFFKFSLLHCNRNWQRRKKGRKNKLTMKDETLTHPKEKFRSLRMYGLRI